MPDDALAPVIPPVFVPKLQAKELGTEEVNAMLVAAPLQTDAVLAVVTAGLGFTVTVIVYAGPAQEPVVAVGVTTYSTVPAADELGFVKV